MGGRVTRGVSGTPTKERGCKDESRGLCGRGRRTPPTHPVVEGRPKPLPPGWALRCTPVGGTRRSVVSLRLLDRLRDLPGTRHCPARVGRSPESKGRTVILVVEGWVKCPATFYYRRRRKLFETYYSLLFSVVTFLSRSRKPHSFPIKSHTTL